MAPRTSTAASRKGAPNTRRHVYIDTAAAKGTCAKDIGAIDNKCKPETHTEKESRQKKAPGPLGKIKLPGHVGTAKNPGAQWINDHCEFLMIKPSSPEQMFKELEKIPSQMAEDLGVQALEAVEAKAKDRLEKAIEAKLAKTAGKQIVGRVGSFLGGPWTGIAVNIGMTVDGANDALNAAKEFPELAKEIEQTAAKLKDAKAQISDIEGRLDRYKKADGSYNKQKMIADMMEAAAKINPCIRARRCAMVPYKKTENPLAGRDGQGCCPGQTGHHALPEAMFKECSEYVHDAAPTICVEGTTNTHGSHGTAHKRLEDELDKIGFPEGAKITKESAIQAGARSVVAAFPESGCDAKCIQAQLHSFYDKLNCVPKSASGKSLGGKKDGGEGSSSSAGRKKGR